jgi:hypothetical protein
MYNKEQDLGELMGQQAVHEGQPMAQQPAPIMMDHATFAQILQTMVQAQIAQMQPPGPPPGMPPQAGPPIPQGGPPQGVDPRIAQALMQGGM